MKTPKALTVFSLTMITVGSVDSIRNLPATALFGSKLIAFYLLGALFFLIPCALVSAELASGWPKQGGVYIWVREAFGRRAGFLAIWLQWIENVIWYPTLLSFVAGTIGYLLNPHLIDNKYFLIGVIIASFWGTTAINLRGMKSSASFANLCAVAGLLLPMILIIGLGSAWLMLDKPLQIHFKMDDLIPSILHENTWSSLTAIILSFCGIEIATVHAGDVDGPQKAFPKALAYSVLIILTTLILGSLAIAIVLPQNNINLVAGIMQAFHAFLSAYHLEFGIGFIALMLVLGGLGGVSNWIIAPTKGLLVAAEDGNLPPFFQKTNRHQAPKNMLILQALIVTLLTAAFLFMPSVNGAYWLLTALAAQLYMLMYLMMFLAAIALRIKQPSVHRSYQIPGGNWGLYLVALLGIIGVLVTIGISFFPPDNIDVGNLKNYEELLIGGLVLMCLPPFLCRFFEKEHWKKA
jgi:amino acid transporter